MSHFTQLIGQPQAVQLLSQAIAQNRIAPAYLFAGSDGVGKKVAAKGFIELICNKPVKSGNIGDLLWVEPTYLHQGQRISVAEAAAQGVKKKAPPEVRLDQIREISVFLSRPPLIAPRSIVVIEQAETMGEAAANALLKTLEEPGQATIILLAPSVGSLLPTLVSRCQTIPFVRLDIKGMQQVLTQIGQTEILQTPEIIALAQGSPGAAIAHSQQLSQIPIDLLDRVRTLPQNYRQALEIARQIDKSLEIDSQIWLVDYLQQYYWKKWQQKALLEPLETARRYLLSYVQPRLVWECTFLTFRNLTAGS
ncbi:DNA polymerase III subunit delta' [Merismopedia glauca]|uniref:DNA polymerase III subunit delta n=1 Tax=Merismopedia glauca CCAP 1448/3 TaxID=1296344 RepID=A0A2T1C350_9CYAN|nr:DNA polymerase III subunit delta' [Merismopedia glauca]PSB02691.1 DNA polymerase III subunit delta' [Merismopedia glauca CCAP 1448/3]